MDEFLLKFANENFAEALVISGILAFIKVMKPKILEIYNKFNEAMDLKISINKYNELFEVGKKIWYQVEEDYNLKEKLKQKYDNKAEYFKELIIKKFPNIKDEDIDLVRQAISGEVHSKNNITK